MKRDRNNKADIVRLIECTNRIEESMRREMTICKDMLHDAQAHCRAFRAIFMMSVSAANYELPEEWKKAYIALCIASGTPVTPEETKALKLSVEHNS